MVETLGIKHHYLRIPPLVLGMAGTAFFLLKSAVKSLMFLDVSLDFLVAIRAQTGLRIFVKTDVTLLTFRFKFGVPLYDFTRHQRGLTRPQRDAGKSQE